MNSQCVPMTATTFGRNHPHLCMNVWSLSRPNSTELCFRSHKIEVSGQKKRGSFYWALYLVLKDREKNVMEEGEFSKPFNIAKLFENKFKISLYTEAHCWYCLSHHYNCCTCNPIISFVKFFKTITNKQRSFRDHCSKNSQHKIIQDLTSRISSLNLINVQRREWAMKLIKTRDKWLLTKDILSGKRLYFSLEIQMSSAAGNIHFITPFACSKGLSLPLNPILCNKCRGIITLYLVVFSHVPKLSSLQIWWFYAQIQKVVGSVPYNRLLFFPSCRWWRR